MADNSNGKKSSHDAWYLDKSINIPVPSDMDHEKLLKSLSDNRKELERLKRDYFKAQKKDASGRRKKMFWKEICRCVNAIEVVKNRLVLNSDKYHLNEFDTEHPDDACDRFLNGGCFPAGTFVRTSDGFQDIAVINKGDTVIAFNPARRTLNRRRIIAVLKHSSNRLWKICFADGSQLRTTSIHSFFVDGKWKRANEIRKGDATHFVNDFGSMVTRLVNDSFPVNEKEDVFNLVVEGDFTFIVNGAIAHSFSYFRNYRIMGWRLYTMIQKKNVKASMCNIESNTGNYDYL